ncbi:hypothetical protein F5878DRAFT_728392 [Lentinula raphanica]|uniref:HMG box domain-containing protein n=1 Tax=Lentinula raphanica TaxID=153919 RepID=A0AA38U8H7_9AGAR|nr:hypothetical protein F5878DRAFT_728392 [Lentinula raphanica]
MPPYRSANEYPRRSRRLSRQEPKVYDETGFEIFDDFDFSYPTEQAPIQPPASITPPPPPSPQRSRPSSDSYIVSHARRRNQDHIPRPPNAFIVYRSHWWDEHKYSPSVDRDHRQVSRIVAHRWHTLSEEQRLPFRQEAEVRKQQHALMYPGYKYAPGTRKSKPRKKVSRDSRAEKARCDKIVGEYFLEKSEMLYTLEDPDVKREPSATPELLPSPLPNSPSDNVSDVANVDDETPIDSPSAEEFVPTDEIPTLELSSPTLTLDIEEEKLPLSEQQQLSFTHDTTDRSPTTRPYLGSPLQNTNFPSQTSFDATLDFGTSGFDYNLWNSSPSVSPLFETDALASNMSQSDYLLSCSGLFGTSSSSEDTFDYSQFLNL